MSSALSMPRGESANVMVRRAVLALALVVWSVVGLLTPYLLAVIGIVAFVAMAMRGSLFEAYRSDRVALAFLGGFTILAICFAITARQPYDVVYALNFVMFALYPAFATLFRSGARAERAAEIGDLALAGTIVAFVAAAASLLVFGWARAESPLFGAILLANTTLLLGFLSLIGVIARRRWDWRYALGPLLGVIVIAMTGSRGPLLAIVPLALVAAWFVWREARLRPLVVFAGLVAYLAFSAVVIVGLPSRSTTIVTAIGGVLDDPVRLGPGGLTFPPPEVVPEDSSTGIRLALYEAGYEAFLKSPIIGHGWARLMEAPLPFIAPGYEEYLASLPHLHNDIIDFAVTAGVIGIAVYVLLLVTPFVAAWRGPRDSLYGARLFGATTLCTAYAFDGLTDLMFGMEFHSALFVVLTAILIGYCRDAPAGRP